LFHFSEMKSFRQTNNNTNVLVLTWTMVLLLSRHVTGMLVAAPFVAAAGTAAGAAAGGAAAGTAATAGVAGATATAAGGTAAGIAGTTGGIAAATTGTAAACVVTGGLIIVIGIGALADEVSYEIIVENQLASLPNFTEFAGTNYNETNNELNYVESEDRYNRHLDLISMMRMEKPSRNIIS
jgi:hypothetical protein